MSEAITKKKLAIVSFEGPHKIIGGVQRRIAGEIAFFSENDVFDIHVIYSGEGKPYKQNGVLFYPLHIPKVIYPLQTVLFSHKVSRLIKSLSPFDILETHHDAGLSALLAGRSAYKKWVEVVHGVFLDEFLTIRKFYSLFSRDFLRASGLLPLSLIERAAAMRADAVVAVSKFAENRLIGLYGVEKKKIWVIPNGLQDDIFRSGKSRSKSLKAGNRFHFLYIGRLDPRKGLLDLIDAFALAANEIPDIELEIIGSGSQSDKAKVRCIELGIDKKIFFRGNVSDEEVISAYRSADILCMPSLQEGQGIVALEAQATGIPVIGTYSGGLSEVVVDGKTGYLVPPHEPCCMAEKMIELAKSPILLSQMRKNALIWAEEFRWKNQLMRQQELFDDLLANEGCEYKCTLA